MHETGHSPPLVGAQHETGVLLSCALVLVPVFVLVLVLVHDQRRRKTTNLPKTEIVAFPQEKEERIIGFHWVQWCLCSCKGKAVDQK